MELDLILNQKPEANNMNSSILINIYGKGNLSVILQTNLFTYAYYQVNVKQA